ncbi:MAG: hypothetical protein K0B07_03715 [DPANN group archaeon]|nr:hypothetical protein [DPANN group archaeon]
MANITYNIEHADDFLRFRIQVNSISKIRYLKVSAVLYLKSGKEYVFMPNVTSSEINTTYPERSVNHLTQVDDGEFQFFFYPKDDVPITLRILASVDDVLIDKFFKLKY